MPNGTNVKVIDPWLYNPEISIAGQTIAAGIGAGLLFVEFESGLRAWVSANEIREG